MTTYDHSVTGSDIVKQALLYVRGIGAHEEVAGEQLDDGLMTLNNLLKSWQGQGLHRWTKKEVIVFLAAAQPAYLLGPASTDAEWCTEDDFYASTLSAAALSGATTFTVTAASSTNPQGQTISLTVGDRIGIELDSGVMQWTTIKTISGTTVTPASVLSGAAASGNVVYSYTSRPQRPLRVIHARRRDNATADDIPVWIVPHETYQNQVRKTSSGTVVEMYYKPTLTSGVLNIWQTPNSAKSLLFMTVEYPLGDVDSGGENPDFPIEWADAMALNLAVRFEPQYGQLEAARIQSLRQDAALALEAIKMFDLDNGSVYLSPRFR